MRYIGNIIKIVFYSIYCFFLLILYLISKIIYLTSSILLAVVSFIRTFSVFIGASLILVFSIKNLFPYASDIRVAAKFFFSSSLKDTYEGHLIIGTAIIIGVIFRKVLNQLHPPLFQFNWNFYNISGLRKVSLQENMQKISYLCNTMKQSIKKRNTALGADNEI